jgi:hypothetical protein
VPRSDSGADISNIASDLADCRQRGLDWLDRSTHNQTPVRARDLQELAGRYAALSQIAVAGRIGQIKALLRDALDDLSRQGDYADASLIRELFFGDQEEAVLPPPGELLERARRRAGDSSEARFRERRQAAFRAFAGFLVQFVEHAEREHAYSARRTELSASAPENDLARRLTAGGGSAWRSTALAARHGRIYVLDTNVLMHYPRFDRFRWNERLQGELIRLIIPLAVIDELDAQKYVERDEIRQRARELLAIIDNLVTESPADGYTELTDGVTIEVLPDEAGHRRMPSIDQEILDRCAALSELTAHPITLVTGDTGMRIKALARGVSVLKLASEDILPYL